MTKKRVAEKSKYIKVKNSGIHNKGVFSKRDIPKGTKIIEYVGEIITKTESDKRAEKQLNLSESHTKDGGVYIFELNKKYDIDGKVPWNKAKYINHSCNPNAETENIKGHIWIIAIKDIKKGKEITYNYGYDLENYQDHPCKCNSKNCMGYITAEEHWPKLKRKLKNKKIKRK
jgi:uncharacterized protein